MVYWVFKKKKKNRYQRTCPPSLQGCCTSLSITQIELPLKAGTMNGHHERAPWKNKYFLQNGFYVFCKLQIVRSSREWFLSAIFFSRTEPGKKLPWYIATEFQEPLNLSLVLWDNNFMLNTQTVIFSMFTQQYVLMNLILLTMYFKLSQLTMYFKCLLFYCICVIFILTTPCWWKVPQVNLLKYLASDS